MSIRKYRNIACVLLNSALTHWGWVTHICVVKLTTIGSDNGLAPGRPQAIIWTNAGILLIGPLETNFSEILFGIHTSSFKKMHLKMSSAKWRAFYLGLNVLNNHELHLIPWIIVQAASFYKLYASVKIAIYFKRNWKAPIVSTMLENNRLSSWCRYYMQHCIVALMQCSVPFPHNWQDWNCFTQMWHLSH